jgi:hypothetical protein
MVKVSAGPVADAAMRERAHVVSEWRREELARVRASADQWRAGLAGLLGLLTTVLVVKGRSTIESIERPYQVAVALLLGLALVCAAAASTLAMFAAHGLPRLRQTEEDAGAVLVSDRRLAQGAARALWIAITGTLLTLTLLSASVAITWFAPLSESEPNVTVVLQDGTRACGQLVTADASRVILRSSSGPVTVVTARLGSLAVTPSCAS